MAEEANITPVITREMVYILPSVKADRITMPDVQECLLEDSPKLRNPPPEASAPAAAEGEAAASEAGASEGEAAKESSEKTESGTESGSGLDGESVEMTCEVKYVWNAPCMMVIFDDGDLNSAIFYLMESLQDPFALDAVAVLLVQESLLEEITGRVVSLMRPLDSRVANHPCYQRTLLKIAELKPKVIVGPPNSVLPDATPMLVRDIPHKYLGEGPTGIITMHVFRTPLEATIVYRKESPMLPIASVSMWNERVSCVYDVLALMNIDTFKINCFNVDMEPVKKNFEIRRFCAMMHHGYHYETCLVNGQRKIIVFPCGTIFAN
ncbi:uncharacterized protein Dana_GF16130 [Drosophila ananassae]|uniref:Uncharacterized protein n=1 Tax=Drosophila ananassae TaxID=7217 RepID=B3M0I0_DROAN|nr:uncharacterized protein LOC6498927 [Drosophila ananassae]EDV44227.2 uncharacterized protein Dana_GF16130 [Drosophila ananassae]